jgi:hypothetical protein
MNSMSSLMAHYQENPNMPPAEAMNSWVSQISNSPAMLQQQNAVNQMQGQMAQHPQMLQQQGMQNIPPGARTPSGMGQPGGAPNHQFMSPAMANQLLPNAINGSPHLMHQTHTPSPASHPMVAHNSQQGTNSSATASVNTSPNVSNKRRRSTAKIEPDDGGGDVNGAGAVQKVKQSPRVGGNKRVKQANN